MPASVDVLAMLQAAMADAKPDPDFAKKYGPPVALTADQALPIVFDIERPFAADSPDDGTATDAGTGKPGPVLGKDNKAGKDEKTGTGKEEKTGTGKTGKDEKTGKENKTGGKTHS